MATRANRRRAAAGGVGSVLAAVLLLTGCSAPTPTSAGSHDSGTALVAPSSASPAPSPSSPVLVPDGTAQQNLPLFHAVTEGVWSSPHRASGRAYVDALVKAGFAKSAMQVTEDLSTVGNPAESMQFSVRWRDGRCLVGQVGPATGRPLTKVLDGLPEENA